MDKLLNLSVPLLKNRDTHSSSLKGLQGLYLLISWCTKNMLGMCWMLWLRPSNYYQNLFYYFFFFMAPSVAYGSSHARDQIGAAAGRAAPQPHPHWIQAASMIYDTDACSNARSLTHWEGPGIKPTSLWTPCWVLNPLSHNENSQDLILKCKNTLLGDRNIL